MANIYQDGTYFKNHPTWGAEDSAWKANQIAKMIKTHDIKVSSICEIGCGAGETLAQLSKKLPGKISFSGYDISPQAISLCLMRERENVHFHCTDLLKETDIYFDLVLAIDVVEHVEDCFSFLREMKNKGALKIFHIPLDIFALSVLHGNDFAKGRNTVGHIHYFVKETALALLRDTGYEVIDYFYTRPSVELPQHRFSAVMLKFPRRILFSANKDLAARLLGGFPLMVLAK